MMIPDFIAAFLVDQSPKEVFNAINNVRGWWSGLYGEEIVGNTEKLNDEFTFHAGGGVHYSKQKLVEVVPDKKVVWLVIDSKLTFIDDQTEWNGTKITFDISEKGGKTELRFTHLGLVPKIECYDGCSSAWGRYLQQFLIPLIAKGAAKPNKN
jgi:hypothetical protein